MNVVTKIIQDKALTVLSLLLLGAVLGAVADPTIQNDKPFNEFDYRASQVDGMMQELLNNPTTENIDSAYTYLSIEGDWAYRQTGEQKGDYEAYLEACNDVRLGIKHDDLKQSDIDLMDDLYSKFN